MLVRCVRIISPATGQEVPEHPSMTVGRVYPVLEVLTSANRVLLRIPHEEGDFDSPAVWDAAMFEVVSDLVPPCWSAGLSDGRLHLAPRAWQRPGFWEDFFDGDVEANQEYRRFKQMILAESRPEGEPSQRE